MWSKERRLLTALATDTRHVVTPECPTGSRLQLQIQGLGSKQRNNETRGEKQVTFSVIHCRVIIRILQAMFTALSIMKRLLPEFTEQRIALSPV